MKPFDSVGINSEDFAKFIGVSPRLAKAWYDDIVVPPLHIMAIMQNWQAFTPLLNATIVKAEQRVDTQKKRRHRELFLENRDALRLSVIVRRYKNCQKVTEPFTAMDDFYHTHYYTKSTLAKMFDTSPKQIDRWRTCKKPLPDYVTLVIEDGGDDEQRLTDEHLGIMYEAKGIKPTTFL